MEYDVHRIASPRMHMCETNESGWKGERAIQAHSHITHAYTMRSFIFTKKGFAIEARESEKRERELS